MCVCVWLTNRFPVDRKSVLLIFKANRRHGWQRRDKRHGKCIIILITIIIIVIIFITGLLLSCFYDDDDYYYYYYCCCCCPPTVSTTMHALTVVVPCLL